MALLRSKSVVLAQRLRGWSQTRAEWAAPGKHPRWGSAEEVTRSQASILAGFWRWTRCFCSTKGERAVPSALPESANAYEVLGIARHCSQEEIQAAFRALAKATHPDLQPPDAQLSSTASFVRILAAYQILSDPQKRAHYDAHLRLRSDVAKRKHGSVTPVAQQPEPTGDTDCVEWLRHYRWMVAQLVHHPQLGKGDGLEDRIRGEVHSALRKAYFGPTVRSETLPYCFEGEERAEPAGVMDVLHLVSGRQLLGVVRQVGGIFLAEEEKTAVPLPHVAVAAASTKSQTRPGSDNGSPGSKSSPRKEKDKGGDLGQDNSGAFVDLELHLFGRVVARASRRAADSTLSDEIWVHLSGDSHEDEEGMTCSTSSDILLGTIYGIGSTTSSCVVHDGQGKKTHLILQHWTPMVKHMLWYRLGQGPARCECRSRRARLPPSRYWLFEPRCTTHNVGGWYFETFRHKDVDLEEDYSRLAQEENVDAWVGQRLGLLHPAMYIMAAAYKTLDEEAVKTERQGRGYSFIPWWTKKWRFFSFWFKS